MSEELRPQLQEIVDDFGTVPTADRLQLLLEFADELPELPQRYQDDPALLEPVPECQSPIFLATEVNGTGPEALVSVFFQAPPEAPTTRGFAGILAAGLENATAAEIAAIPADLPLQFSLAEVVSPLRLGGMSGMLARIQRQVREKAGLPQQS